jgi:VWA domain-containing protein
MHARKHSAFSVSFLDTITCALGAIILLTLSQVCHARRSMESAASAKELKKKVSEAAAEAAARRKEVAALEAAMGELEKQAESDGQMISALEDMRRRLSKIEFVGITTQKKRILILLDLSGSMKSHWSTLLAVAKGIVGVLPEEDCQFNVMGFTTGIPDNRVVALSPDRVLQPVTDGTVNTALRAINRMVNDYAHPGSKHQGGTPTEEALEYAFSFVDRAGRDIEAIFLVTDGAPNSCLTKKGGKPDPEGMRGFLDWVRRIKDDRARSGKSPIEVHCLGVGEAFYENKEFRGLLKQLSREMGGTCAGF